MSHKQAEKRPFWLFPRWARDIKTENTKRLNKAKRAMNKHPLNVESDYSLSLQLFIRLGENIDSIINNSLAEYKEANGQD